MWTDHAALNEVQNKSRRAVWIMWKGYLQMLDVSFRKHAHIGCDSAHCRSIKFIKSSSKSGGQIVEKGK